MHLINWVDEFNDILFTLFIVCYLYQMVYVLIALFKRGQQYVSHKDHRYAVAIAARDESAVIAQLIESIKRQNYPGHLIDIYVVADNCTDDTAKRAHDAGAIVYERFNSEQKGKGYALDHLFKQVLSSMRGSRYQGFFVFDADNLLDKNYITEMNKVFDNGYRVITCYRNSKNYDTNWISSGYGLWFLRESKYLNNSRMLIGSSSAISGTGFLVHSDIIRKNNGWKHHLLTEDIEFTVDSVCQGEIIGYCGTAIIYDEQPVTFRQSFCQRLRWSKGFYQVFAAYGKRLFTNLFSKRNFSSYDMLMTITPAMILSFMLLFLNASALAYAAALDLPTRVIFNLLSSFAGVLFDIYRSFFVFGVITLATEWKKIYGKPVKKFFSAFTFPLFMMTYIPIALAAMFQKVEWKPIDHTVTLSIDEMG